MCRRAILPLTLLACSLSAQEVAQKPDKSEKAEPDEAQVQQTTRRPRIRLAGISVGVGYSRWSGYPWGYGGYGYGYGPWRSFYPGYYAYDSLFYPFYHHPYYNAGFGWGPNMGEVKLQADQKNAEVYVDGAFAGNASERKTMWLDPGAYNLEVRAPGKEPYTKRIYVLSGKTLRVNAKLEGKPEAQQ